MCFSMHSLELPFQKPRSWSRQNRQLITRKRGSTVLLTLLINKKKGPKRTYTSKLQYQRFYHQFKETDNFSLGNYVSSKFLFITVDQYLHPSFVSMVLHGNFLVFASFLLCIRSLLFSYYSVKFYSHYAQYHYIIFRKTMESIKTSMSSYSNQ